MNRKILYNPSGNETLDEPLIGGNPTGMLNMNKSRYKWAKNIYDQMEANTWFPSEVATANEAKSYRLLSEAQQRAYDLVFAQLSFNDSLQADNLMDNINGYITNKMVNACLSRQAWEEINHSKSYAVLLQDAVENSDTIFDLFRRDPVLNNKNQQIANKYAELTEGEVTPEKLLYAMVANQILEGVYFLSGFSVIYSMSDIMRGSADMISFIHRDELTHLALFSNMIKEMFKEYPDLANLYVRKNINDMFKQAYELEVEWMMYITQDMLGFTRDIIEKTVAYFCEDRMKLIGVGGTGMFNHGEKTYIVQLLDKFGNHNEAKTNFFEGNVKNYSKGSLKFEDDWDKI